MPAKSPFVPFVDTYSTSDAAGSTSRRIRVKHPLKAIMNNQQQIDANRIANWVQDQGITYAGHPQNSLGMQSGLPRDAGNENQHTPNHPGPITNPNPFQIITYREFITTSFPLLKYRKFTVNKIISSAEWVSANRDLVHEMSQHDREDVDLQAIIEHRISPDLWPIIPPDIRPLAYEWLTASQRATLGMPLPEFQTDMTIVEEHIITPHPEEVCLRALEREISNLPKVYAHSAALMKFELNHMFTRHLDSIRRHKKAQRWLNQQIHQAHQSTLAMWINSWTGRDDGMRPPSPLTD
jgi:hypothetical protein